MLEASFMAFVVFLIQGEGSPHILQGCNIWIRD